MRAATFQSCSTPLEFTVVEVMLCKGKHIAVFVVITFVEEIGTVGWEAGSCRDDRLGREC
jgi:hypothetical protein